MSARVELQLRSNIKHPYDYCFSKSAELVFLRMYHTPSLQAKDVSRREMFARLEASGIQTVPNGITRDLLARHDPQWGVVVYTDERAHRGEGKIWVPAKEALELYPDHWASLFIPPAGRAIRHFQFGARAFSMPFRSDADWRCQRGAGSYSYCVPGSRWEHLFPEVIPHPYFALDFIPGTDMATDFQFVPGIENDRLDNWMRPREMYQSLQEAAAILVARNQILGDKEAGYGLIRASELRDEPEWLSRLGEHELTPF